MRKVLLRTGVYATPQGELYATPERVKGWADKFRAMSRAGIKIPVSYGHHRDAWPLGPGESDDARRQYHLSAYNAGYLSRMDVGAGGELDAGMDCPGLELDGGNLVCWRRLGDGTEVKTAVGDVSVAIKNWVDGTGKRWDDAIVHVALTPIPVAHGTGGFSLACVGEDQPVTLSLSSLLHTLSDGEVEMADETSKTDETPKKPEGEGGGKGGGAKDHFAEAMGFLAKKGIHLPDDTTPENVWERLCIVGHALEEGGHMDDAPDDEFDELPAEGESAEATGGTETPATEEQRPVMMSLSTAKTPAERGSMRRADKDHKARLQARIGRLVKRGMIKPALRADLERQLAAYQTGFTLSADEEMVPVDQRLDQRIADLEMSLIGAHPLKGLRTAKVVDRPAGRSAEQARQAQEAAGDELAALAGVRK